MSDAVTISLSPHQVAEFRALDTQEANARKLLDSVPVARTFAARGIVLQSYTAEQIANQPLRIDCDGASITFVPNEVSHGG